VDGERGSRLGSFLIGGLVGSVAGVAAAGRMRVKMRRPPARTGGLAAFEQAPCFLEVVERERRDAPSADEEGASLR
jgi:hypothetical protein